MDNKNLFEIIPTKIFTKITFHLTLLTGINLLQVSKRFIAIKSSLDEAKKWLKYIYIFIDSEEGWFNKKKFIFVEMFSLHDLLLLYFEVKECLKTVHASSRIEPVFKTVNSVTFNSLTEFTLSKLFLDQSVIQILENLPSPIKLYLLHCEWKDELSLNNAKIDRLIMYIDISKKIGPRITPPSGVKFLELILCMSGFENALSQKLLLISIANCPQLQHL
jgi:hypothetical protein